MSDADTQHSCAQGWISLILRLAVASLFIASSTSKLMGGLRGIQGVVAYFQETFADSWLPGSFVTAHAYATPFVEAIISIWLIVGYRLKIAWLVAALFSISISFGMFVAGDYHTAANNYNYVLICCAGLYFARHDRFSADSFLRDR